MMQLISKVIAQKCNSSGNLQRSSLVWAVFENVALSETLDDLHTLDKFSFTFRSSRSQIIFKTDVLKISWHSQKVSALESFDVVGLQAWNFINKRLQYRCFLWILQNSQKQRFYRAPRGTASVLWTSKIINFNHVLENLRTVDNFNFSNKKR